jgi:hypothetical protein
MRGWVKSKKVWGGIVIGTIAGPWMLGKVQQIFGVGVSGVAGRAGGDG